jgi:hypothetical protein
MGLPDWPITKLEVTEWERFCAEVEQPNRPELVGVAELAALAGVTKQRASILARRSGFPDPVARLAQGDVWNRRQVQEFLEVWTRKPGRPARQAPSAPATDEPQERTRIVIARARAVVDPRIGLVVDEGPDLVIEKGDEGVAEPADEPKERRPRRR